MRAALLQFTTAIKIRADPEHTSGIGISVTQFAMRRSLAISKLSNEYAHECTLPYTEAKECQTFQPTIYRRQRLGANPDEI